jgi:two-component system, OmpR family, alkaline phosphatase synthesis response regulator PhoP
VSSPRGNRRRSERVKDAWIYPFDPALADALRVGVQQLGYTPIDRPLEADRDPDDAESPPAVVLVAAGPADRQRANSLAGDLRALGALHEKPILIATDVAGLATDIPPPLGDDVLVAPWTVPELAMRISRATQRLGLAGDGDLVRIAGLEIDFTTYQVTIDGTPVDFTYMEYELLRFFVTHPNHVFSREALLSRVWGYDFYGETRTVDVHVRRVRAKLGVEHAARIRTVRSVGYRFER